MNAAEYKPCLNVYVVWRPMAEAPGVDKSHGLELARLIYSTFARDIEKPLDYGLGITVFFRSVAAGTGSRTPPPIDLEQAKHSAVILLVNSAMATDPQWGGYVTELSRSVSAAGSRHRIFPVSLSRAALQFDSGIGRTNFIRYHEFAEDGGQNSS